MNRFDHLYEDLLAYVSDLWCIDTHEHTANYKSGPLDYLALTLNNYARLDLVSAGMPQDTLNKARDASLPLMQRWQLVAPCWQACRNTGYIRMHERVAREIYGVDSINEHTIQQISSMFAAKDPSRSYGEGLARSKILCCITDSDPDCDRRHSRPAFRLEEFVERIQVKDVCRNLGVPIHTFSDWLEACDETIRRHVEGGAVAFKTTIATDRTLDIGYGSYQEAEASFRDAIREDNGYQPPTKAYQDFMFRHVLSRVCRHGLPVQLHTGMAASNANIVPNGNPAQLCPLFCEYRDMDFVIMHMGYPYHLELSALGKMFPNVYPDLSWAHIISPHGARLALSEWLDSVPATKIMGFGGDCGHEDGIHAHLLMARENISHVLAQKVCDGCFDLDHAKWIARQILLMNPYRVFHLEKAGVSLPH